MIIKGIYQNWVNITGTSGIGLQKPVKIFNVSTVAVFLASSDTEPSADHEDGVPLLPNTSTTIHADSGNVWAKTFQPHATAELYVQSMIPFSFSDNGIDPRVYTGLQGFTTQSFTEANVKNGTQFDDSSYVASLGSEASLYTAFVTGDKPVLIKSQDIEIDGSGVQLTLYSGGSFTGGVESIPYNLSDDSPEETTVSIFKGITPTVLGTQVSPVLTLIGSVTPGNASTPALNTPGLDRRLKPNTVYIRKIESIDTSGSQRVTSYTTWYEGPLSVELF